MHIGQGFTTLIYVLTCILFTNSSWGGHIWGINYENVQEVHEIFENFAVSYRKVQTTNKKESI